MACPVVLVDVVAVVDVGDVADMSYVWVLGVGSRSRRYTQHYCNHVSVHNNNPAPLDAEIVIGRFHLKGLKQISSLRLPTLPRTT